MTCKMVDYSSRDFPHRSNEQHGDEYSPDIEYTLRSLKVETRSCKAYNNMIVQS